MRRTLKHFWCAPARYWTQAALEGCGEAQERKVAEAASLAASLWLYSIRLCRESLAYLASPSSASSTSASAAPPLPLSLRLSAQKMRLLVSELASRHPAHARAGAAREGRAAPAEAAAAAAASHSFSRIQSTFAAARKRLSQHRLLAWAYAE